MSFSEFSKGVCGKVLERRRQKKWGIMKRELERFSKLITDAALLQAE